MSDDIKSYSQAANQLGFAVTRKCVDTSEIKLIKRLVQDSYNSWAHMIYDKSFLNWGLWDKTIYKEYQELDFDFSTLCRVQDIYSQTLLYSLIRPLVKASFFNKKLLDIGCGNGIGLKVCSQLLKTEYALGIDLVNKLVSNAHGNFHHENKVNFIQSDAENLPLIDESFDIITNLESSHLYPKIEHFFSEVARVLSPGGYFCYADIHVMEKQQARKLDEFVQSQPHLKIIQKVNITKLVQASIYQRLIINEAVLYKNAQSLFGDDKEKLLTEFSSLAYAMGLPFLPWWRIWFKNPILRPLAKDARKNKFWGKKYFFYYLLQKRPK